MWVHEQFDVEVLEDLSYFKEKIFESLFIKVKASNNSFKIVGNIYRAPSANINEFNNILKTILETISKDIFLSKAEEVVLMGDYNINLIQYENHPQTLRYLDTLLTNNFMPHITLPSRITNTSSTLIDHIHSNSKQGSFISGIIYSCISDHMPIFNIGHTSKVGKPSKKEKIQIRKFGPRNKTLFKDKLGEKDWSNVINDNNPRTAFKTFSDTINCDFEECFPLLNVTPRKDLNPINKFMTKALLVSRKNRNKLAAKKLKNPSQENISKYKIYNSKYRSLIRKAKINYYKEKFADNVKNIKQTWSFIKEILGTKNSSFNIPETFTVEGKVFSGATEIAEGFNEFFSTVGPNLSSLIPDSGDDFENYLNDPVDETFIFAKVTKEKIYETLSRLKGKNSSGCDKLSTNLLKDILPFIVDALVHLFNLSLTTGYIPDNYKCARVIPIYKLNTYSKEDTTQFTNYRPISLLSCFSKLLEKLVSSQMFLYLKKYNILYKHQYGFRPKHNTSHSLIHFLDKIYSALNSPQPEYSSAVFLDLKKAFDCVDINILLKKLNHYGFRGISQSWFFNYLNGRTQFVSVNGKNSSLKTILCGVPQGSVLGPILFLLYINDLPNATNFFSSLFADDTFFLKSSPNLDTLMNETNDELEKASRWFIANKLTLNVSKTKFMVFRDKKMHFDENAFKLKIGTEQLKRVGDNCKDKFFKFVGIKLDEHLTWDHQISHVYRKLISGNFVLNRCKNFLPINIRRLIYNSLIQSHLEYGVLAWGSSKNKLITSINKIQKRCIRNLVSSNWLSHTDPLFGKLNILKFKDILDVNSKIFMHKYFNSQLPGSFNNMFTPFAEPNRTKNFILEKPRNKRLETFPKAFLPKCWNALSLDHKNTISHSSFKKYIREDLINEYNEFTCTNNNCSSCSI